MVFEVPGGGVRIEVSEKYIEGAISKAASQVAGGRLVDTAEAAGLLKCSQKHVRNLLERGEFPKPIRLGHLLRWRLVDIEAFLAGQASATGAA